MVCGGGGWERRGAQVWVAEARKFSGFWWCLRQQQKLRLIIFCGPLGGWRPQCDSTAAPTPGAYLGGGSGAHAPPPKMKKEGGAKVSFGPPKIS